MMMVMMVEAPGNDDACSRDLGLTTPSPLLPTTVFIAHPLTVTWMLTALLGTQPLPITRDAVRSCDLCPHGQVWLACWRQIFTPADGIAVRSLRGSSEGCRRKTPVPGL